MRRWSWIGGLGLVALALGCSSVALPDGTGGSGAGGSRSGAGGSPPGTGGTPSGTGGIPIIIGGDGVGGSSNFEGSCGVPHFNPDSAPGGACAPDCQSVACGRPCTQDCCVACGIDLSGAKTCVCPAPGLPFASCSCVQPATIPPGLQGGPCSPQGFSTSTVPVGGPPSLRGTPCKVTSPLTVCYTIDSTASSERGCICESDGIMHCGAVNHWFSNNGVATSWMP